jgi:hypothetical protein
MLPQQPLHSGLPTPPSHPLLLDLSIRAYNRGRNDFVRTLVDALMEPAFADVKMTGPQFAEMLKSAAAKCDAVKAPNSLTN